MTAAVALHHSDMDLLRADDQMDLASSPALPTDDIDFDLDDVREISAEPNQDLMLQDGPDQPIADSDLVGSLVGDLADDDLMLDEDTVIQQEDRTDIPDLSMDNNQGEHVQINDDDDILYEDEEDPQEQEGLYQASSKEQQMEDGLSAENEQLPGKVEITESLEKGFEAEADTDNHDNKPAQEIGHTNSTVERPRSDSAAAAVDAINDVEAGQETSTNVLLELHSDVKLLEDSSLSEASQQDAYAGHQEADIEVQEGKNLELNGKATGVHEPDPKDLKTLGKLSEAQAPSSNPHADPQALVNSGYEETVYESTTQSPLLHTVKIHYLETEMCLFPPTEDDDSEMFFLQDVSLAHESLDKMLRACRDVLANTIGKDDELVLDVASLGLHISEGSRYATQITLSQIIHVYVSLAHKDNVTSVEPLYCSLHSRISLASQYAYLQSAADEGKTLTQILEEKTCLSGENGEEEREYEPLDVNGAVSPEAEGAGKPNIVDPRKDASTIPEREISPALEDAVNNAACRSGAHGPDVEPSEGGRDDTVGENEDTKEAEPRNKEQSPTSTVKGDSNGIEGDYGISLDLCFKPDTCLCSSCANINTDLAVLVSETAENGQSTRDILDDIAKGGGDSSLFKSNAAADPNETDRPDIESNIQESVSSKTLEAENNQLEEDLFSQDNDQPFNNGHDESADIQHDGVENFELGEQKNRGTSDELDNEPSTTSDHPQEHDDFDRRYAAPSSTPDSSNETDARHDDPENDQGLAHAEGGDELLDFDDDESLEQKKTEETSLSRDQITVLGNKNVQGDTIGAHENETSRPEKILSPGMLETRQNGSPVGQSTNTASTEPAEEAPTTPCGGKHGSKRKALDDEDEIDLLDVVTPDKKRRRPS